MNLDFMKTSESTWFRQLGLNETYLMRLSEEHQKLIAMHNWEPSDFRAVYLEVRVNEIIRKVYE